MYLRGKGQNNLMVNLSKALEGEFEFKNELIEGLWSHFLIDKSLNMRRQIYGNVIGLLYRNGAKLF